MMGSFLYHSFWKRSPPCYKHGIGREGQKKEMKAPKNWKYQKQQKMPLTSTMAKRSTQVNFGHYGLQANESKNITAQQLETCRRTLRRAVARKAPIWIRAFPYKPLFAQEQGHRMGKGKGARTGWVSPVRKGQIILEIGHGVDISVVRQAFRLISFQLGISMKLVEKRPAIIGLKAL